MINRIYQTHWSSIILALPIFYFTCLFLLFFFPVALYAHSLTVVVNEDGSLSASAEASWDTSCGELYQGWVSIATPGHNWCIGYGHSAASCQTTIMDVCSRNGEVIYSSAGGCNYPNHYLYYQVQAEPGKTYTCYTGPQGTVNIGICKAGLKTCGGPCIGEVKPQPSDNDCDGEDSNCDGDVDELCPMNDDSTGRELMDCRW